MPRSEAGHISDEVEELMFIKEIDPMPEKVVGHLTEADIAKFTDPDLRLVMFAISAMDQTGNLRWEREQAFMRQARQFEAHWIGIWIAVKNTAKWAVGIIFAGIVTAAIYKFIHP